MKIGKGHKSFGYKLDVITGHSTAKNKRSEILDVKQHTHKKTESKCVKALTERTILRDSKSLKIMKQYFILLFLLLGIIYGCEQEPEGIEMNTLSVIGDQIIHVSEIPSHILIEIESNTKWGVTSNKDWCEVSTTSGSENNSIEVNCSRNISNEARTATILIYGEIAEGIELKITQAANSFSAVTDVDGNVYSVARIGKQAWMLENLKTTKYRDDLPIPVVESDSQWIIVESGAYCWFMNDQNEKNQYGAIYNWEAVHTGKLCPSGFHVPRQAEWDVLFDYQKSQLGTDNIAKSLASTEGWWLSNEENAIGNIQLNNNSSGFSALPSGSRGSDDGHFVVPGYRAEWWTSTRYNSEDAILASLYYGSAEPKFYSSDRSQGFSVRCIKD